MSMHWTGFPNNPKLDSEYQPMLKYIAKYWLQVINYIYKHTQTHIHKTAYMQIVIQMGPLSPRLYVNILCTLCEHVTPVYHLIVLYNIYFYIYQVNHKIISK